MDYQGLNLEGLLSRAADRVRRPSLGASLIDEIRATDELGADSGVGFRVARVLMRRRLDEQVQKGRASLVGFAADLLPEVEADLKAVDHFGCLAGGSPVPANRFDYAMLWCRLAFEMKQQHRALGLGSNVTFGGEKLTGLDAVQTWILLANWGHLFGTFATSRALLWRIENEPSIGEELVSLGPSAGRGAARRLLESRSLQRFHYVVMAAKTGNKSWLAVRPSVVQDLTARFVGSVVTPGENEKDTKLVAAMRRSRQVAMLSLHTLLGVSLGVQVHEFERAVAGLLQGDRVYGTCENLPDPEVSELFDALQSFQGRSVFASVGAATAVLAHLRAFNHWWTRHQANGAGAARMIAELSRKPEGWEEVPVGTYEHFARLQAPSDSTRDWISLVAVWQRDAGDSADNYLVTPDNGELLVDVYHPEGVQPEPATIKRAAEYLAKSSKLSWVENPNKRSRRLWLSAARFLLACLDLCVGEGLTAHIQPAAASRGHIGLAIFAEDAAGLVERARGFARDCTVAERRKELQAVCDLISSGKHVNGEAEASGGSGNVHALVLGSVRLMNASDETVLEIDGVYAEVSSRGVTWHAVECKRRDSSEARKKLTVIESHLSVPVRHRGEARVDRHCVSFLRFDWPTRDAAGEGVQVPSELEDSRG